MVIETKGQVVMALALSAHADTRTVRKWLSDPSKVRPLVATGLAAEAERIGLSEKVARIREEAAL